MYRKVKCDMQNEWLFGADKKDIDIEVDVNAKAQFIMNQIDEGRGWRYTDKQAQTLGKLVDKLVEQVKTQNKKTKTTEHKSSFKFLFFM